MTTYYYLSNYTRNGISGGRPLNAQTLNQSGFNPYGPNTVTDTTSLTTISNTVVGLYPNENQPPPSGTSPINLASNISTRALTVFVCGSRALFNNTLGYVISTSQTITNPSLLTPRIIIAPNVKADNPNTNPTINPMIIPIPSNQNIGQVGGPQPVLFDSNNIGILDPTSNLFTYNFTSTLFIYFFLIQNGYTAPSSTDGFVNTNNPIFFSGPVALNTDNSIHFLTLLIDPPLEADFSTTNGTVRVQFFSAFGGEDLNRTVVDPSNTNNDYNDVLFTATVFNY